MREDILDRHHPLPNMQVFHEGKEFSPMSESDGEISSLQGRVREFLRKRENMSFEKVKKRIEAAIIVTQEIYVARSRTPTGCKQKRRGKKIKKKAV